MEKISETIFKIEGKDVKSLLPIRKKDSHKGDFGYVGILGGSLQYSGSIKLASQSLASLRSGAGVVRVIVPKSIVPFIAPYLLEQTLFPIEDKNSDMIYLKDTIDKALDKLQVLAIGMGWGQGNDNLEILTYILEHYTIPIVIDADGLNALAKSNKQILKTTKCKVILTPHQKEFERISGFSKQEIQEDRIGKAKQFANQYQVILLLKGPTTIITDGQIVYLVEKGCPGMATAGSGDVLSGVLVGLLGYNKPDLITVAGSAYLTGFSGEIAQEKKTDISMLASDTIDSLPEAIRRIRNFI